MPLEITGTLLLDVGNIIFFIAALPQLRRSYLNRHTLKDLSLLSFSITLFARFLFLGASILLGAYLTALFAIFYMVYEIITIYWILKNVKKGEY